MVRIVVTLRRKEQVMTGHEGLSGVLAMSSFLIEVGVMWISETGKTY